MAATITLYLKKHLAFFANLEFPLMPTGSLNLLNKNFVLIEQGSGNGYFPDKKRDSKNLVPVKFFVSKRRRNLGKAIFQYLKDKFDNTFYFFMNFATKTQTISESVWQFITEYKLHDVVNFDALIKKYTRYKKKQLVSY